jgi:hypothetical protein
MKRTYHLLLALFVGIALLKCMELLSGYWAALPMPWLRWFGKHTASSILLLLDLCLGIVPAYVLGRLLLRRSGRLLSTALIVGLPWVAMHLYNDYVVIRCLQLHPSFPSALQATLRSWLFLPGMVVTLLSVPLGLWLAFRPSHRAPAQTL